MSRKISTIIILLCACAIRSWACPSPGNIEGVAFTAGETLNIRVIEEMGIENVNYFIDGDSVTAGIRYLSHYSSQAMVFIGHYGMSYQEGQPLNCMGVILPLPDTADEFTSIGKETFDFAAAVTVELRWLTEYSVLSLPEEVISAIDSALTKATNGGGQYWTHANSVLGYNSWFNYDSTNHKWSEAGEDGVNGVEGVLGGIRGEQGLHGCSVISPGVTVPPASLETTAISRSRSAAHQSTHRLRLNHFRNGDLAVHLPPAAKAGRRLSIYNCRGVVMYRTTVATGLTSIQVKGLPRGRYFGRLK